MRRPVVVGCVRVREVPPQTERDFAFALLSLADSEEPAGLLQDALRALVEITGSVHGYVELRDEDEPVLAWHASEGFAPAELGAVRQLLSSGIMAATRARGEMLRSTMASDDPRFADFESVKANAIEAVICGPLWAPPLEGVVYLQGRTTPLPFSERDEGYVRIFSRAVVSATQGLLASERKRRGDELRGRWWSMEGLVARGPEIQGVLDQLGTAAELDVTITLLGPSGVGKSMLARAVHRHSQRSAHKFVELNCATLPDSLFENEMFGAAPGAHSAAQSGGSLGKVAVAHRGTLFLDEVSELSAAAQAKLLQFLQSGEYYRLGDDTTSHADVRLITATNRNLEQMVLEKEFREDLYYRLSVLSVRIPTLAERKGEVVALARHFARTAAERHGLPSRPLSAGAESALLGAEWPGNIRQLAHVVEAAVVRAHVRAAQQLEARDVFPDGPSEPEAAIDTLQAQVERFRGVVVEKTLAETDWNVSEAARRLDVARSYLYTLIRAHGLERASR